MKKQIVHFVVIIMTVMISNAEGSSKMHKVSSVQEGVQVGSLSTKMSQIPGKTLFGEGMPWGEVRLGRTEKNILVDARVEDPAVERKENFWEGSCFQIYFSSSRTGAPITQIVFLPGVAGKEAEIAFYRSGVKMSAQADFFIKKTKGGYHVTAIIPAEKLGIDLSKPFYFEADATVWRERGTRLTANLFESMGAYQNASRFGAAFCEPASRLSEIRGRDGKMMVLIPGGESVMGSNTGYAEERPQRPVVVESFYMDRYPVTNGEFKKFCDATKTPYPVDPKWPGYPNYFADYTDYPVVNVSLAQARAYAVWAGKRLPTEAEWEYAAQGGDRGAIYPWGHQEPSGEHANFADRNTDYAWRNVTVSDGYEHTSPVGTYFPNAHGLYDMAGNVYEWVDDQTQQAATDGWGGRQVAKGGAYYGSAFDLRIARRRQVYGGQANYAVGFRCVRDEKPVDAPKMKPAKNASPSVDWKKLSVNSPSDVRLVTLSEDLTPESAARLKKLGFRSVQQYVTWESIEGAGRGQWNFEKWDRQLAILEKAGLKWMPFVVVGPAYSLPRWYLDSHDSVPLRCLEHGIESKVESVWNPSFRPHVERFLKAFAEHYRNHPAVDAMYLGVSGDFGEALYPHSHGDWFPVQIHGLYHTHSGYWCGDRFAVSDFRRAMREKYRRINELNKVWGTRYASFESVRMPDLQVDPVEGFRTDEGTQAGRYFPRTSGQRIMWLDFIDWYRNSMDQYADFCLRTARHFFPSTELYLVTGGDGSDPHLGSNFALQSRTAAKYGAGVHVTNENSEYEENFVRTNWLISSGLFFGSNYGTEPAGILNEEGIAGRVYHASSTGMSELEFHFGDGTRWSQSYLDTFTQNIQLLKRGIPNRTVGVLYPDTSIILGFDSTSDIPQNLALLRDYTDADYLDDVLIQSGALHSKTVMIICGGQWHRQATLDRLMEWVKKGGKLVGYNISSLYEVETGKNMMEVFFHPGGGRKKIGQGGSFYVAGARPASYRADDGLRAAMQKDVFDPVTDWLSSEGVIMADGILDRIYVAKTSLGWMVFNQNPHSAEKNIFPAKDKSISVKIEPQGIITHEKDP